MGASLGDIFLDLACYFKLLQTVVSLLSSYIMYYDLLVVLCIFVVELGKSCFGKHKIKRTSKMFPHSFLLFIFHAFPLIYLFNV